MSEPCKQCEQYVKKINILTSDFEFQIKKIQQDKSTEKALYEVHLQKQIRKWQQLYNQEKEAREQQNQQWISKYDQLIAKNQEEIEILRVQAENTKNQIISKLTSQHTSKYDKMLNSQLQKLKQTKDTYELKFIDLKELYRRETEQMIRNHSEIVENLKKSHNSLLNLKCKQYEGIITGKQSQLKTECIMHEKTKQEAKQVQTRMHEEIFQKKKQTIEQEASIKQLNNIISENKKEISNLRIQIEMLVEKNRKDIIEREQLLKEKVIEIEESAKERIKTIYQESLQHFDLYQEALKEIEQTRQCEKQLYSNNLQEIQKNIENKNSKTEDLELIENLKINLYKKQRECQMLGDELRSYRLQLENKEETYNKIFVPVSGVMNENSHGLLLKRKDFKLRKTGKSVATVREALHSSNNGNSYDKRSNLIQLEKVL